MSTTTHIDETKVQEFAMSVLADDAAALSMALAHLGHRLGLYAGMAGAGPLTATQLATRTDTDPRSVREWLDNQVAGGWVEGDHEAGTYRLPDEHAAVLAVPDSPAFMLGGLEALAAPWARMDQLEQAFRSGEGLAWADQDPRLFTGTEGFFEPEYRARLTREWIPALDGIEARLEAGGHVADVGTGHGAPLVLLARAYPRATLSGFDYHAGSIDTARTRAADAGVDERVTFEVAAASDFPGDGYDLVCFFDTLHDLGDPVGAAGHARAALADGGALLVVEPFAADDLRDNINPLGRMGYAISTLFCTPNSLSQDVGAALGAQAGPQRLGEVLHEAGFSTVRQAVESDTKLVLEARQ